MFINRYFINRKLNWYSISLLLVS